MAVIKSGILGGLSGSIGNVTGSSWKGIAVLRTKPLSVANPNTPAQQAVRTPWASLTKLGSSITGVILQPVWNGIASKMSGYNLFLQQKMLNRHFLHWVNFYLWVYLYRLVLYQVLLFRLTNLHLLLQCRLMLQLLYHVYRLLQQINCMLLSILTVFI